MRTATLSTSAGPFTVPAAEPVPGLLAYELPAEVAPTSPYRWVLAHHEGPALAAFESEDAATRGAVAVALLADWTRGQMTAANEISFGGNSARLLRLLRAAGGEHPNA